MCGFYPDVPMALARQVLPRKLYFDMEQFVFGLVYIIHCILWFHKNLRNLDLYSLDKLCSEQQSLSRFLLTKAKNDETISDNRF